MSVARPLFLKGMNLLGIAGLAASCASPAEPSKNIQPTSISTPIPQGISCDPEKFAKEHNVTRIKIGGDESDNPQQTEYIRRLREIYDKIDQCTPLSKEDLAFAQNIDPKPKGTVAPAIPTETPEKKPLFSKLFPGIDISNAEIIPYKEGGDEFELVGITLPPGTDLTAYTDLEVSKNEARAPFSGSDAFLDIPEDAGIGAIVIIGNFKFIREIPATEKIKAGNKYATTTETDGKNLQGKTLIVWISKMDRSTKKFFTPKELVEKYFPGIHSKPKAQQTDYQGPIIGQTIYKYFGGPND